VDIKRLGRFDRVGHRITRKRSFGSKKQGFEFVYVATDDNSRLCYAEIHADERSEAACTFLKNAVSWFGGLKIDIERVMTDNGSPFVSREFGRLCSDVGIKHKRTRPYTPRTNGKVERFIQTLLREWAYVTPYATSQERRRALRPWVRYYNRERPHASLGYQPPLTRLQRAA
jgi:transposase InsO family protein